MTHPLAAALLLGLTVLLAGIAGRGIKGWLKGKGM